MQASQGRDPELFQKVNYFEIGLVHPVSESFITFGATDEFDIDDDEI